MGGVHSDSCGGVTKMAGGVAGASAGGRWVAKLGPGLWIPQLLWQCGYVAFCIKTLGAGATLPSLMASPAPLSGVVFLGPASIPSVSRGGLSSCCLLPSCPPRLLSAPPSARMSARAGMSLGKLPGPLGFSGKLLGSLVWKEGTPLEPAACSRRLRTLPFAPSSFPSSGTMAWSPCEGEPENQAGGKGLSSLLPHLSAHTELSQGFPGTKAP